MTPYSEMHVFFNKLIKNKFKKNKKFLSEFLLYYLDFFTVTDKNWDNIDQANECIYNRCL